MAAKASRSDLITGLFAALVIFAFIGTVLFLQAWSPEPEGHRYSVRFSNSGGLGVNSPVLVAGQRVGKVEQIDARPIIDADGSRRVEIIVTFFVTEEFTDVVTIPVDTIARVQSGGLFGGTQLALELGQSSDIVKPGERLPNEGQKPVEIGDLLAAANETIKKLQTGFDRVATLLNDPETTDNISEALKSLKSALATFDEGLTQMKPAFSKVGPTIESAQSLLEEIRTLISDNNANINNTLASLESASSKIDSLLSEDGDGVPQLVSNLNTIADNLDKLVGNVNDLVLDNQLNVQISMENIRETTDSLRYFARRIENDPSLLIWGGSEKENPALDGPRPVPNVDELSIRNSGRRPRKESD
ncbi:MAG: MCE family protein [Planctomycetes bacterium]|nr:MCE family protein [Planctomycetota bacterium]